MKAALAQHITRLYPSRWRSRYGDEFAAVLEESPLTPLLLADVLYHAGRERLDAGRISLKKAFARRRREGVALLIVFSLLYLPSLPFPSATRRGIPAFQPRFLFP